MRRRLIKLFLVIVCLIAAVVIVALIVAIVPPGYKPPPLPNPNGYPGLVQATQTLVGDGSTNLSESQLEALVQSNSTALQIVRSNLSEPMQVPVVYSQAYGSTHLTELSALKRAALALAEEGRLAQIQNRPRDAPKAGLDTIELGINCPRGAPLIDGLVGEAIEAIGVSELRKLSNSLDAETCKMATRRIEDIDAQRQTWKDVLQQEHYWASRTFPVWQRVMATIATFRSTQLLERRAGQKYEAAANNSRRLMIDLAARAYTLENGHPPAKTTDLVPGYLKAIPLDASTGTNMTYLP